MVGAMQPLARFAAAALALPLAALPPSGFAAPSRHPAPARSTAHQVQDKEGIQHLGGAQGWQAYSDTIRGGKVCYLVGEPSKSEPAGLKRGKIFASVTHRPAEKVANEVSFTAGYAFKEGSDAELAVDGKKFSLFTNKDAAWSRDAATDKAVVQAMARGKEAVIKGTSARGTATSDVYSLAGFGQALALIDKACGVKR